MIAIALQSGSNGNCIYAESNGVGLLFDAGISGRKAEERLANCGRDIRNVTALIISHDHGDHIRCAGVYQRKYGLPIYVTPKTRNAALKTSRLGKLHDVRLFDAGERLQFGRVSVETIPTPHDAADGVVFVMESRRKRLGILTDLGHVFDGLSDVVSSLDAAFIESNYDREMLENGPYPPFLKARIRGPGGHISNSESAELIHVSARSRLRWVCLSHLSERNNSPEIAVQTHQGVSRGRCALCAASRYESTGELRI